MHLESDPDMDSETEQKSPSKKDLAKKMRREAYLRAKEYKKNDPREIARKAQAKEMRRAAYQKAKEKNKAAKKREKPDLSKHVAVASDLPEDTRPLAPVISIDFLKRKLKES